MSEIINIYCDESCHLEQDGQKSMVLGAVWCGKDNAGSLSAQMREIKKKHGLNTRFEIKWTKVSPAKVEFYLDVLGFFFQEDDLYFRALIVPDKSKLDHAAWEQTHDDWYYKMYFEMLKAIIDPKRRHHIYLDIKDSRGRAKVAKLHEVLANSMYDFSRTIIERVQVIRSQESEIMQLADLLIGVISYANRELTGNAGKTALVNRMKERSGYTLTRTTLYRENKVNLFRWSPQEARI